MSTKTAFERTPETALETAVKALRQYELQAISIVITEPKLVPIITIGRDEFAKLRNRLHCEPSTLIGEHGIAFFNIDILGVKIRAVV